MKTIFFLTLLFFSFSITTFGQSKSTDKDLYPLSSKPITLLKISFVHTKIEYQYFLIGGLRCPIISNIQKKQNWQALNHSSIESILRFY